MALIIKTGTSSLLLTPEVLEQLLEQLQKFLKILDGEKLSGNATVQKGLLNDLLQSYKSSNGGDEEYIYMNKVIVTGQNQDKTGESIIFTKTNLQNFCRCEDENGP
ncbi:Actin filament-associated protein 1-like 2 [Anabarilius grahami]|uniref:Actin filament-associated protein 1-like 2 n=1 Tax=Anabarilius grahami TaxID=495550 RepID=A0A3N0XNP6_ANAGA|nr:Actin filament-associated protein 1-like 2 [Anabarilius grahami]